MSTLTTSIDEELQKIIDHSFQLAEELLNEEGSYHPFGLTINKEGEIIPFTFQLEEGEAIDTQQIIDELDTVLNTQLENKEIKAYGISYDVQIELNEEGDLSNALLVDVTHEEDKLVPYYFFAYEMVDGKAIFGDSFGLEK